MADYNTLSDAQLTDLLKESDHTAFKVIYDRYHYLMLVHAYKKLQDEELAKDMVQDLFINLWLKRSKISSIGSLAPVLYTSLKNQIINFMVHQGVQSKYILSVKDYIANAHTADTDHQVREKDLQAYIDSQIQSLPKKMRKMFELSRKEDLSYQEISKITGTSEGNVSKHITSAVKILRIKLTNLLSLLL